MALGRYRTALLLCASLALLGCSYSINAQELDDSLSTIVDFEYSDGQGEVEYGEYDTVVDEPETNRPTVTTPSDDKPVDQDAGEDEGDEDPETMSPPEESVSIDQGVATVPAADNLIENIITPMLNDTMAVSPQPVVSLNETQVTPGSTLAEQISAVPPAMVPASGEITQPSSAIRPYLISSLATLVCTIVLVQ